MKTIKAWVVGSSLFVGACYQGSEDAEVFERSLEIEENLLAAGYPESEIQILDDGQVYVGSDAIVTLEASREMAGKSARGDADHYRQYRTNNVVSSQVQVICIDGSAYSGVLSSALDGAIDSYNALDLSFEMVRTNGSGSGCDALIDARLTQGSGGFAGFPSGGLPFGAINIGVSVANLGVPVARHVITHELGHTLGMRHTDFFNRSISCGQGGNEGNGGVGAVHIPGTPTGASFNGSLMNSCFNQNSNGQFTTTDVIAFNELYGTEGDGQPPSSGGDDPNSCEDTNACGGRAPGGCYCDDACVQFGDCCSDGPC